MEVADRPVGRLPNPDLQWDLGKVLSWAERFQPGVVGEFVAILANETRAGFLEAHRVTSRINKEVLEGCREEAEWRQKVIGEFSGIHANCQAIRAEVERHIRWQADAEPAVGALKTQVEGFAIEFRGKFDEIETHLDKSARTLASVENQISPCCKLWGHSPPIFRVWRLE